jgi:hypothetical protein
MFTITICICLWTLVALTSAGVHAAGGRLPVHERADHSAAADGLRHGAAPCRRLDGPLPDVWPLAAVQLAMC